MKILWLVNIVMPELAVHLGQTPSVFGGWLTGAMNAVRDSDHTLTICTTAPGKRSRYEVGGVTYYLVPQGDLDDMSRDFRTILSDEVPDVVHIYGTEFAHSWALARETDPERLLVTVQGSLEVLKNAAYAGLDERLCRDTLLHKALRILHKGGQSIQLQRDSFALRSKYERLVLRHAKYVNGGSNWGCSVARWINPDCITLECGLILRDSFYPGGLWDADVCTPHTVCAVFTYPIKGFHKLLEAFPAILRRFPDARLRIVGSKLAHRSYTGLKKNVMDHAPDYQWLIQNQIDSLGIGDSIDFLGYLDESCVRAELLNSNVFVSPSAMENQSTALGEAMILGVPSIASCVGAMQEMIDHGKDGFLYPFNETYMLADYICRIFESRELSEQFSREGRKHAQKTYNKEENCRKLFEMYDIVAGNR